MPSASNNERVRKVPDKLKPWVTHLKAYIDRHPGLSAAVAAKNARSSYKSTAATRKN